MATNTVQVILHLTTGVLDLDSKIAQNTLDLRNERNHQSFVLFLKVYKQFATIVKIYMSKNGDNEE